MNGGMNYWIVKHTAAYRGQLGPRPGPKPDSVHRSLARAACFATKSFFPRVFRAFLSLSLHRFLRENLSSRK